MTQTEYDARASACVHLLSAQLRLVDDPEAERVVAALDELRADLALSLASNRRLTYAELTGR